MPPALPQDALGEDIVPVHASSMTKEEDHIAPA
jgi:hypothetical protein